MSAETYKAISARVRSAIDLIDTGRAQDAKGVLERLSSVLPPPEMRHVESAMNSNPDEATKWPVIG